MLELSRPALRDEISDKRFLKLFLAITDKNGGVSEIERSENMLLLLSRLMNYRIHNPNFIMPKAFNVYLLYMAWSIFQSRGMLSLNGHVHNGKTPCQIIVSAVLINVLNPKLSIFFAFLPQFVTMDSSTQFSHMIELSLVFMFVTYIVFAIYGIFAATLRQYVIYSASFQKGMRRGFAAAFAILAVQLALTHR